MNNRRPRFSSMISTTITIACLVTMSLFIPAANADQTGPWQVAVGTGLSYAPRYEGAAYSRLRLLPLIDVSYNKGGFFIGIARGIGFNFSKSKYVQYGARVLLGQSRSQDEDPRLYGTGYIDYFPEAGLFLSTQLGPLSISSGIASSHYGTHADLGSGVGFSIGNADRFRLSANINWADIMYNQTYFGITAAQATASGNVLTVYDASAGKKDSTLSASWRHSFSTGWFGNTSLSYKRLEGSAQLSPLTQRLSTLSFAYILGYRF